MRNSNKIRFVLICISICFLSYILTFFGCSTTQRGKKGRPSDERVAEFPKMVVGESWVVRDYKGIHHIKVIKVFPDGGFILETRAPNSSNIYHLTYDNGYHLIKKN